MGGLTRAYGLTAKLGALNPHPQPSKLLHCLAPPPCTTRKKKPQDPTRAYRTGIWHIAHRLGLKRAKAEIIRLPNCWRFRKRELVLSLFLSRDCNAPSPEPLQPSLLRESYAGVGFCPFTQGALNSVQLRESEQVLNEATPTHAARLVQSAGNAVSKNNPWLSGRLSTAAKSQNKDCCQSTQKYTGNSSHSIDQKLVKSEY